MKESNGYLEAIDGNSHIIYSRYDTIHSSPPYYFYSAEVDVYPEQPLWGVVPMT